MGMLKFDVDMLKYMGYVKVYVSMSKLTWVCQS